MPVRIWPACRGLPLSLGVSIVAAAASFVLSIEAVALVPFGTLSHPAVAAPRRQRPTGRLVLVPGRSRASGPGAVRRVAIYVEGGLRLDRGAFAETVKGVLFDPRGWSHGGIAFRRVSHRPAIRIALASPRTTDRLCAPLPTRGRASCHNQGLVVLNLWRWRHGTPDYARIDRYRQYVVNHEVGHALGHTHVSCQRHGARAPVMMQQTYGVGACRPNPWPLPSERG